MRIVYCALASCLLAASLVLGCESGGTGPAGQEGPAGEAGTPGMPGTAGTPGSLVGTIQGTVVSAADGRVLPNVSVVLSSPGALPGDAGGPTSTSTDTTGAFSLKNEPIGYYQLTFTLAGFVTKTVTVGNNVAGPTILAVTLATDTTTTAGVVGAAAAATTKTPAAPTFQLTVSSSNGSTDPYVVGFGTQVTVGVSMLQDTSEPYDAGSFTYAWKISTAPTTTNPAGAYTFNSTPTSSSAVFTTLSLAATKAVEAFVYPSPLPEAGAATMGYIGRLGVLGINPDETGNYSVSLTVTDPEGHYYTFSQPIRSTWQTSNLANVAVGNPVYLQGDTFAAPNWLEQSPSFWKWPNTSWTWTVTSAPTGSSVTTQTLQNANTQFPSFVPDVTGEYDLQVVETSSYATTGSGPGWEAGTYGTQTSTVVVYAGTYEGVMNTTPANLVCTTCHQADAGAFFTPGLGQIQASGGGIAPDFFSPWKNTAHESALQRKMDGFVGGHFGESCLQCHTLGWSNAATAESNPLNGGFTYEMTQAGVDGGTWSWPASITAADGGPMVPGAYESLVANFPKLAPLAGIQCENCHGPAQGPAQSHPGLLTMYNARVDWSAQLCASCHQENNNHYFPSQWGPSNHGNVEVAVQRASVESKASTYGGGADPQSGAQFCARCHSAQGFVQYLRLLQNGAYDRYDFITTDDKKLAAGGGNAPTTAYLSSIGLNAGQVQPQTCVSCHDPHSNGAFGAAGVDCSQEANYGNIACTQLRVYDSLPGLPSGQGAISGVGAGAICMACHNGRNGEHTDVRDQSPYAETPHDSTATEALFGFNAYFVSEYNPSPHLAIQDTCVGCHVKLPTSAETAAGQTGNHGFATDLSICSNCHGSAGVDGAGIQAQVASELSALSSLVANKEINDITNLNATSGGDLGLCVRVSSISNATCTGGSCASSQVPTAVPFPIAPSNVWLPPGTIKSVTLSGGPSTSVTLNLNSNALSIPYYDPQQITKQVGTLSSPTKITVAIYTIMAGSGGASGSTGCGMSAAPAFASNVQTVQGTPYAGYVYLPSTTTAKAIWNINMLNNEGSGGIHNFPWTTAVLNATTQAVNDANTAGTY
jgi:predicted CXXCH cytochrome family protein